MEGQSHCEPMSKNAAKCTIIFTCNNSNHVLFFFGFFITKNKKINKKEEESKQCLGRYVSPSFRSRKRN